MTWPSQSSDFNVLHDVWLIVETVEFTLRLSELPVAISSRHDVISLKTWVFGSNAVRSSQLRYVRISPDLRSARGQNLVFWTTADVPFIYILDDIFQNASQAHAVFLPHGTMHNTLDSKEALRLIASGYWIIILCYWEAEHQP